ncbi:MAG: Rieske 2Fe-2S domain-containing protein [Chloroflexota bacterium]
MAAEHIVAQVTDIPEGQSRIVKIGAREIGIFNVRGQFYALPNICIHQGGPLCEGRISGTLTARAENNWKFEWTHEGEIVTCPWHALEYNITTGQCLAFPNRRVRSYPVTVAGGQITVVL